MFVDVDDGSTLVFFMSNQDDEMWTMPDWLHFQPINRAFYGFAPKA